MIKNHWRFDLNYISQNRFQGKIAQARPKSTARQDWRKISYTYMHTHTHTTALCRSDQAPYSPGELPKLQYCWPLGSRPTLLGLTWRQSSKVRGSHLWCLNQRIVQSSSRTGIKSHSPLFDLGQFLSFLKITLKNNFEGWENDLNFWTRSRCKT